MIERDRYQVYSIATPENGTGNILKSDFKDLDAALKRGNEEKDSPDYVAVMLVDIQRNIVMVFKGDINPFLPALNSELSLIHI